MTVEDKVRNHIFNYLEDSRLLPDIRMVKLESRLVEDLNADDLAVVEIILEIEDCFEFEIPDEDTDALKTGQDIVNYVRAHAPNL